MEITSSLEVELNLKHGAQSKRLMLSVKILILKRHFCSALLTLPYNFTFLSFLFLSRWVGCNVKGKDKFIGYVQFVYYLQPGA